MEFLKTKAVITTAILTTAVLPKALYYASDGYLSFYNRASSYIVDTSESALNAIGLETIKPEPEKDLNYIVNKYASLYRLNPNLLKALIRHESLDNPDAISLKGAIGYAQIMPDNYKRCGLKRKSELWDAEKNIKCGAQIFSEELNTYQGDILKALNAYNGGPKAVNSKTGGDSPYAESNRHAKEVLRLFAQNSL